MSKSLLSQKQEFYNLLNRAVRTNDSAIRRKAKCGCYSGKKTGQHRTASASKKQSGKFHQ